MFSLKELPDIQGVFKVCQISPSFLAVFFFYAGKLWMVRNR